MSMVTVTPSIPSGGLVIQFWAEPGVEQANVTRHNLTLQDDCPAEVADAAQAAYDQLVALNDLATHTYQPGQNPEYAPVGP